MGGLRSSMLIEIGHVEAIFRYPVKPMAGERLEAAKLGWHGLDGDGRLAFRRMSKIFHLVLLAMLLSASSATGQPGPLVVTEHDWTLKTGNRSYGVYQSRWLGAGTYTSVFFGHRLFTLRMRAGLLVALVAAPFGVMGIFLLIRREREKETAV